MGPGPTRPLLLIVEDEPGVAALLRRKCTGAGYLVETATTGDRGGELALSNDYDLIILDVDLPGRSGLDILSELRRRGKQTPVLLLTIRSGEEAIAQGLDAGADDYLEKPFSMVEFTARCRALLRRGRQAAPPELAHGDLRLDRAGHRVFVDDTPLDLPPREFELLRALLRSADRVVSREDLLRSVWGVDFDPGTNRVDVTVSRLRRALREADATVRIETVRGAGFRLQEV
ncbi:MAG: response regulator transcription factor [Gemmatimonadota bacterium]